MAGREAKKGDRIHIAEAHPDPRGEQMVAEMPLETDHSAATRQNIARNPSMAENRMNPSVVVQDASTDSMFNLADPQSKELLNNQTDKARGSVRGQNKRGGRSRKAA